MNMHALCSAFRGVRAGGVFSQTRRGAIAGGMEGRGGRDRVRETEGNGEAERDERRW